MTILPNLSPELIQTYEEEISRRNSPATAKRKMSSLKRFFGWAHKEGHIPQNPVPKPVQTIQKPAAVKEVKQPAEPKPVKKNSLPTILFRGALIGGMAVLIFLLVTKLQLPIPFKPAPASNETISEVEPIVEQAVLLSPWTIITKMNLKDSDGIPAVGTQSITFKLYSSEDDNQSFWSSSTRTLTPDVNGDILISLDDVPAELFFENEKLFLAAETTQGELGSRLPVSTANVSANLQGYYPAQPEGALPNTIPVISNEGALLLATEAPAIKATEGNLLVEGQTLTLSTPTASDGDITINPDGSGIAHFLFEGTDSNFLNAQAPNLISGSLYYGIVANNATGYDLLRLQSGSSPVTRFSVDALGNTDVGGELNVEGNISTEDTIRLTEDGALTNITGYQQTDGNFSITQSGGETATISKINTTALSDVLTLTLDERGKPATSNSIYSTLTLKRYDGAREAMALLVDEGNAQFNGQVRLGRYPTNPDSIGTGSLVYNSTDNSVYVWDGSIWTAVGSGGSSYWTQTSGVLYPLTITDDIAVGGTDSTAPFFVNDSGVATFSTDTNLYRSTANTLATDDSFVVGGNLDTNGLTNDIAGTLNLSGNTLASTTDLTIDPTGGGVKIGTGTPGSVDLAGDDLYVTQDLEVDGVIYGDGTGITGITASDLTCTDCLDFTELADSLTLDVSTDIALGTLTFSSSGTGALDFNSTGQVSFAGNVDAENGLDVTTANLTVGGANFSVAPGTGNITTAGDIDVNGSTNDIAGTLNLSGNTLTSTGDLTVNPGGGDVALTNGVALIVGGHATGGGYNVFADSTDAKDEAAISSDNDLYIGGDLEVDGVIYGTLAGGATSSWSDLTAPTANLSLSHAEYASTFTWDTADSSAIFDGFTLGITNDATTDGGNQRLFVLENNDDALTTGITESLLVLDNLDTNEAVTTALSIANTGGGGFTTDISLQNSETILNTTDSELALSDGTNTLTLDFDEDTATAIDLTTNGSVDLTFNPGGNVGIQDTTPSVALNVGSANTGHSLSGTGADADLLVSDDLELDGVLYLDGGNISNSAGTATITLSATPTITTNVLSASSWLVENTANVGLAALMVNQQKAGDLFTASAAGVPKFVIDNSGNVGIGGVLNVGSTSTTTYSRFGTGITNHGLSAANDVLISNGLEINGVLYPDSGIADSDGTVTITMDADEDVTMAGDLTTIGNTTVGSTSRAANTYVRALAGDDYSAGFEAYGARQGTGYTYVGQSTSHGGGIFYNGNGAPAFATGESSDRISFYRRAASVNNVVFSYSYNSSSVAFVGNATFGGGTGKITVGTVDPVYDVGGEKYATYMAGMIGIKEETVGVIKTDQYIPGIGYKHTIDFTNQERGSDLWLFGKATDIGKHIGNLVVLLSSSDNTKAWYEIDQENYTLSIYTSRPTSVSYRLTAPRFDAEEWSNYNYDIEASGFVVDNDDLIGNGITEHTIPTLSDYEIFTDNSEYKIRTIKGEIVEGLEAFANLAVANIKAGAIQVTDLTVGGSAYVADTLQAGAIKTASVTTKTLVAFQATVDNLLVTNGLVSPIVQTSMISPLADSDLVIDLNNATPDATESAYGKLIVKGEEDKEVASIDAEGNATFSGTLESEEVKTKELTADKIYVDEIISKSSPTDKSPITIEEIEELLRQSQEDQLTLTNVAESNIFTATDSARLEELTLGQLYVTGNTAINTLSVSSSLTIGSDFVAQSLTDESGLIINSLDTLNAPLKLQSLAMAPLEIMAGKVRIDTNGNMEISGNLYVAGEIEAAGLTLKDTNLEDASEFGNLLSLIDAEGIEVANINASGAAEFASVAINKLIIASSDLSLDQPNVDGEINTNATAGKAIIPAGTTEIRINNPNIGDYTLVYVTPTSSTLNNVLYVKSKEIGSFTVGFSTSLSIDVNFNWWVIDLAE